MRFSSWKSSWKTFQTQWMTTIVTIIGSIEYRRFKVKWETEIDGRDVERDCDVECFYNNQTQKLSFHFYLKNFSISPLDDDDNLFFFSRNESRVLHRGSVILIPAGSLRSFQRAVPRRLRPFSVSSLFLVGFTAFALSRADLFGYARLI